MEMKKGSANPNNKKILNDLYKKSYNKILMVESQLLCQRKR